MLRTLLFVSSSRDLKGAELRLDDGRIFGLDRSGQITIDLDPGRHHLEVRADEKWLSAVVDAGDAESMYIIDVDVGDTTPGMIGKSLNGRYHIDAVEGQSRIGIAYRGTDSRLERPVLIEVVDERRFSDPETHRRFEDVGGRLASFSHPHLATVYDATVLEERRVLICEVVEGIAVDDGLRRGGPLDVDDLLAGAYQLATAIAFLHDRQFVHGDLTPSSIVAEDGGGLRLVDYGLARSIDGSAAAGERIPRRPAYMAPEQIQEGRTTEASDIYRLGIIAFELLTGELPFDFDTDKLVAFRRDNLVAYAEAPLRRVDELRDDLPQQLIELLQRCLHRDPEQRPAAAAVADELARLYLDRRQKRPPEQFSPRRWPVDNGEDLPEEPPRPAPEPVKPAVSDIDPHPGGKPDPEAFEQGSQDYELDRPVRRIALFIFVIAVTIVIAVLAHFFLVEVETPQPTPPDQQEVVE